MDISEKWANLVLAWNASGAGAALADLLGPLLHLVDAHPVLAMFGTGGVCVFSLIFGLHRMEKKGNLARYAAWLTWPDLADYALAHPPCMTQRGVRCFHCHGGSSRNVRYAGSGLRIVICNSCNNGLYRT